MDENAKKVFKESQEVVQLRLEVKQLTALLNKSPHEAGCASLTPRPQSISAYFDYQPPHCNCYKGHFLYEQEKAIRSDHEFSY